VRDYGPDFHQKNISIKIKVIIKLLFLSKVSKYLSDSRRCFMKKCLMRASISYLTLISMPAGAEWVEIHGTDKLIDSMDKHYHIAGHMDLDKCYSSNLKKKPFANMGKISLQADQFIEATDEASLSFEGSIKKIMSMEKPEEKPESSGEIPRSTKVKRFTRSSSNSRTKEDMGAELLYSLNFDKGSNDVNIKVLIYNMQGILLWSEPMKCAWGWGISFKYKTKNTSSG